MRDLYDHRKTQGDENGRKKEDQQKDEERGLQRQHCSHLAQ